MTRNRILNRVAFLLALLLALGPLATACPRDPRPERTPRPSPTAERPLQTGRQPAPEVTR